MVLAPEEADPAVFFENKEQRQKDQKRFEVALGRLEGHRRQIIELRYGLGEDRKAHSTEEISQIIGISVSRVNILETRALKYLTYFLQGKVDKHVKDKLKDLG